MKYIIIAAAALLLSACKEQETIRGDSGNSYYAECIDGVEYWKNTHGNAGYMSPRINPETLEFVRCTKVVDIH